MSNRIVTVAASVLIGVAIPAAPIARGTSQVAVATRKPGVRQQDSASRYWTPSRMRAALRNAWANGNTMGAGLRWDHAGAVGQSTGKVFFTLNGADYVCSGSVVDGPRGRDVVMTAAHCVGSRPGRWAAHWTFIPGYADGAEPYGAYTARRFFVPPRWAKTAGRSAAGERYDVAFVTVNPYRGRPLGAAARGQRVAFRTEASKLAKNGMDTYVFGYPNESPFSGSYPDFCAGAIGAVARDGAVFLRCGMTAGDSGGPWFARFNPRTGTGTIVAVTTYKLSGGGSPLYGTLLGRDAQKAYEAAVSSSGR